MFDLSGQYKGEQSESEPKSMDAGNRLESFRQKVTDCPSILTGLSREMRTQMNAVVAFSFLLNKNEYDEDEREEFSNQIYNSCDQIISLFDNFIDSALIDTGNSGSESCICNLDEMFSNLYSEFREKLKKERYKDVILISDNQTFHKSEYLIDAIRLIKVIRNLFQNALNNTKSGYIKIGYFVRRDKLTCFIMDSGLGYLKCREFLQSQDMTHSLLKFNDTFMAVSLALTRKLIEIMEGSIWIEKNRLTGTGIYFSIPVSSPVNAEDEMNKYSNTTSPV